MPTGRDRHHVSLSDLHVKRVHVGAHYQYHDGARFVSQAAVERTRQRAVQRLERAAEREAEQRRAVRAERAEAREAERRREAAAARRAEREAERRRAERPVKPTRKVAPPPAAPPSRRPRGAEAEPPRGFRPVPPRVRLKVEPVEREPGPKDLVQIRGSFVKYRDRASGQYFKANVYASLPPKLREGIKREVHVRQEMGEWGVRVMPLVRHLTMAMRQGLTWEQVGEDYRQAAVRLSLV